MGIMSYQEFIKETPKPKLSLSDLLMVKGLKDPAKPAKPLKVTQAMVERAGKDRFYPTTYSVVEGQKSISRCFAVKEVTLTEEDGSISIIYHGAVSSPEITSAYVAKYCSMNNLKVAS